MTYTSDDWMANYYEIDALEQEMVLVENLIESMREEVALWADGDVAPMDYTESIAFDNFKALLKQEIVDIDGEMCEQSKEDDLEKEVDVIIEKLITYRSCRVMFDYLDKRMSELQSESRRIEDYLIMMEVIYDPDELWELAKE